MNLKEKKIKINLKDLITFAENFWKYKNISQKNNPKLNREIKKFLNNNDINIIDLSGKEYDPGMSVEVIYFKKNKNTGVKIVDKMLTPVILYKDSVVKEGQVIITQKEENNNE